MGLFFKAFTDAKQHYLLGILLFGFSSGSAFTLVSFIIPYQLSAAKYTTDIIGSMFLTTLPYCLKPLWAPFVDKFAVPILCTRFGQRRGWALAAQGCLLVSITSFIIISPIDNLLITAIIAFIISCCAATQDIVLDAYRIERPSTKEELSVAVTFGGMGFRLGILISSIGALHLSSMFNWGIVYLGAFFISMIGPLIVLNIREPVCKEARHVSKALISLKQYFAVIRESILVLKHSQPRWGLIILFVFLYKASDSVPMAMSSPLFIDLSFSAHEIASISKAYGLIVMIFGGFVGGVLMTKLGNFRSILIGGTIQLLAPLMFMILALSGHNILIFIITITIQNFSCGLGGTIIAIYLANLCNSEFIATQFAIIASFSSFTRIILSSMSGFFAKYITWPQFFLANTLLSMLFIVVFLSMNRKKS